MLVYVWVDKWISLNMSVIQGVAQLAEDNIANAVSIVKALIPDIDLTEAHQLVKEWREVSLHSSYSSYCLIYDGEVTRFSLSVAKGLAILATNHKIPAIQVLRAICPTMNLKPAKELIELISSQEI